jgi:hypothetical protein
MVIGGGPDTFATMSRGEYAKTNIGMEVQEMDLEISRVSVAAA